MEKKYPSQKQDRYIIRFRDGMRDLIKDQAHNNNRTMNAEIVSLLEAALAGKSNNIDDIADAVANRVVYALKGGV